MACSQFFVAGLLIPGLVYAAPVLASDGPDSVRSPERVLHEEVVREPMEVRSGVPFAGAAIADDAQLASVAGKENINDIQQTVNAKNTSTVSGNIINGDPVTGDISIDGASFGGFNGLALVSANTGNNVSINSSMNVNVGIQQ